MLDSSSSVLTMMACVEKLDEKEDIMLVTSHLSPSLPRVTSCGHCMCGSNLRLWRTDQAPVTPTWSEPSRCRHGLTILASHWSARCRQPPLLASVEASQALREMRLKTLFQDDDCVKRNNLKTLLCLLGLFTHMLPRGECQRWTNT